MSRSIGVQSNGINGGHQKSHTNTCAPRQSGRQTKAEKRLDSRVKGYNNIMASVDPVKARGYTKPGSLAK